MVNVDSWIDMDSNDFKRLEKCNQIRKIINVGIEGGLIKIDFAGYMWVEDNPVHAELDGKIVGIRYAAKATN
jgi:hypothetical protein